MSDNFLEYLCNGAVIYHTGTTEVAVTSEKDAAKDFAFVKYGIARFTVINAFAWSVLTNSMPRVNNSIASFSSL